MVLIVSFQSIASLLSCCALMHKLNSVSFSGQLIHFFSSLFTKKAAAGKQFDAPVERDRPRSRTAELDQLDKVDEQAHAMDLLDKVDKQAH